MVPGLSIPALMLFLPPDGLVPWQLDCEQLISTLASFWW